MRKYTLLFGALLLPPALSAQATTSLSTYVASDGTVAGDPVVLGASVAWGVGHLGLRLGLAVDARTAISGSEPERGAGPDGLVNSDADALLYLADPQRQATVIPYLVAGLGMRAVNASGRTRLGGLWGAGGGVRTPITDRIALDGEARWREPLSHDPDAPAGVVQAGMEYRIGLSVRLGRGASAVVPPAPILRPQPVPVVTGGSSAERARVAQRALTEAERHLGVPYRWGGNAPAEGFDCSGFIRYVFRQQGIDVPRVSRDQALAGRALPLDLSLLEPGDILAFASRGTVDHTAIYAGNGRIIHASSSGGAVRYDDLNSRRGDWYRRHMVAARRVIPDQPQLGGR